jgi:pimeloyl-ACP methyl ester carboxylesterase
MIDERKQFRILYRDFLSRMVDLELIAAGGDAKGLIVRFGSLLAALSFVIAYLMVPRYLTTTHSHKQLARFAWNDEDFLISATITVAGLCAVMAWNTVFPDRRDSLILGLIPVRMRTMILARLAAIASVLGSAIAAINIFTGLSFPFALSSGILDGLRSLLVWWIVILAAGALTFCAGLVLQGIAAQLLPWKWFLRVSGLLQMLALFALFAGFFLTPPFDTLNPPAYVPSFWFVGLLHEMRGDTLPLFETLASRALTGLAIVIPLAGLLYILAWSRNVRRIVESPDILPAKHSLITNALAKMWSPAPFARAILLFTARTISRSRQHRLMLAIYGGFAFALSLAFSASLLGPSREHWNKPNGPFVLAGFLLVACAVTGTRTIFSLPITLPANWIFRITAVHRPADYFGAVRSSLYAIGLLPVWIVAAIGYLSIWPGRPAFEQIAILGLIGIVMVERSLYQFRKIPFTCSWLPGSTHGKMKVGIWVCVFLVLGTAAAAIEVWSLEKPARLIVVLAILGAAALRARRRTTEFAAESENRLQFEDALPADIYALDLRQDGAWLGDEAYDEAIDPNMGRSLLLRLRPFAIGALLLLTAGVAYEQTGEFRDRRAFPQVGRSVDIGGRSLNLYCSGTGSPTVVFESNWGAPGYTWVAIQRKTATFTRACWYDRAGYAWSDPGPFPNHSDTIARDLHKVLSVAGVPSPYVLVGHAMGGFHVRVYRGYYPREVAGLVLVDPMNEDMTINVHNHIEALRPVVVTIFSVLSEIGFFRLIADDPGPPPRGLTAHEWSTLKRLKSAVASCKEPPLWVSGELARASGGFGDIPVIVLTAGKPDQEEDPELDRDYFAKVALHDKLAQRSTHGTQVIVEQSGHQIPWQAPGAVVDAVRTVVEAARQ